MDGVCIVIIVHNPIHINVHYTHRPVVLEVTLCRRLFKNMADTCFLS